MRSSVGVGRQSRPNSFVNHVDRTSGPSSLQNDTLTSIIRIKINGKYVNLLLDSGSCVSAISDEYSKQLNVEIQPFQEGAGRELQSVGSEKIELLGWTCIDVQIDDFVFKHNAYVINKLCRKVLFGMDFLKKFNVNCSYRSGVVTLDGEGRRVSVPFVSETMFAGVARLSQPAVIFPHSVAILQVQFRGTGNQDYELRPLTNPPPFLRFGGQVRGNRKPAVKLFNASNRVQRLNRFGPIACVMKKTGSNDDRINSNLWLHRLITCNGSFCTTNIDESIDVCNNHTHSLIKPCIEPVLRDHGPNNHGYTEQYEKCIMHHRGPRDNRPDTSCFYSNNTYSKQGGVPAEEGRGNNAPAISSVYSSVSTQLPDYTVQQFSSGVYTPSTQSQSETFDKSHLEQLSQPESLVGFKLHENNVDEQKLISRQPDEIKSSNLGERSLTYDTTLPPILKEMSPIIKTEINENIFGSDSEQLIIHSVPTNESFHDSAAHEALMNNNIAASVSDLLVNSKLNLEEKHVVGNLDKQESVNLTSVPTDLVETKKNVANTIPAEPVPLTEAEINIRRHDLALKKKPIDRTCEDLGIKIEHPELSSYETKPFADLITKYSDVFAMQDSELTGCNVLKVKLRLKDPNCKPSRGRIYTHSREAQKEIDRQIKGLLNNGFIEKSNSPYTSGVFLVKKSNNTSRLVHDFRLINSLIREEIAPLPQLGEIIRKISAIQPKWFCSLDCKSAYQQLIVDEDSRDFLSFSPNSLNSYKFVRMSYGLSVAPSVWQGLMTSLIGDDDVLNKHCSVFFDDILLYAPDLDTMHDVLERLFIILRRSKLFLHDGKCAFLKTEVKYLGHGFGRDGHFALPGKLDAMLKFKRPTTKRTLKSFLGLVGYYRVYIKGFALDAAILQDLLKQTSTWHWTEKHEESFQRLRESLKGVPTLAYPIEVDLSKPDMHPFIIQTDASKKAVAYCLSQVGFDGREQLLACAGRKLRENEGKSYTACELELLALVLAVQNFRVLIQGRKFIVRSDNISIKYLKNLKFCSSGRLARWAIALSEVVANAELQHISGPNNVLADSLSRADYDPPGEPSEEERDLTEGTVDFAYLSDLEGKDSCLENDFSDNLVQTIEASVKEADSAFGEGLLDLQDFEKFSSISEGVVEEIEMTPSMFCQICSMKLGGENEEGVEAEPAFSHDSQPVFSFDADEESEGEVEVEPNISIRNLVHPSSSTIVHIEYDDECYRSFTSLKSSREIKTVQHAGNSELEILVIEPGKDWEYDKTQFEMDGQSFLVVEEVSASDTDLVAEEELRTEEDFESNVSRAEVEKEEEKQNELDLEEVSKTFQEATDDEILRDLQRKDPELKYWFDYIEKGTFPQNEKLQNEIRHLRQFYFIDTNGVLCYSKTIKNKRLKALTDSKTCKVIPKALQHRLLTAGHQMSHPGVGRLFEMLSRNFTWKNMYQDCKVFTSSCTVCARCKKGLFGYSAPLKPIPRPSHPFSRLHIDTMVSFEPKGVQGESSVLTVIDSFSSFVWFYPLVDQKAATIVEKLLDVFSFTGFPDELVSDCAPQLIGEVMQHLCKRLNIARVKIAPATSVRGNSRVERVQRTFNDAIRCAMTEHNLGEQWSCQLPLIQLACRTAVTPSFPLSAAQIVLGFQPRCIPDLIGGDVPQNNLGAPIVAATQRDYVNQLDRRLDLIRRVHAQNILHEQVVMKRNYDKSTREYLPGYQVDQLVWLKEEVCKPNSCGRFTNAFKGPFRVLKVLGDRHVLLQDEETKKPLRNKTHIDKLKPFIPKRTQEENVAEPDVSEKPAKKKEREKSEQEKEVGKDVSENELGDGFFAARRILQQRGFGKKKQFLVEFSPVGKAKPEKMWVLAEDTSDALQAHFNLTHTLGGKLRKKKGSKN